MISVGTSITSVTVLLRGTTALVGDTLDIIGLTAAQAAAATYQWHLDGADISGATGAQYDTTGQSAGVYSATATIGGTDYTSPGLTVSAPPVSGYTATVAAPTTPSPSQPVIFDSGAARGVNAAAIPLSGTTDAPDGTQIKARLVRADDPTQEVHGWANVGTASGGTWNGTFFGAQRSPHRLTVQVRVGDDLGSVASMTGDVMIGHVLVLIGQSEEHRMVLDYFDSQPPQTVPAFADAEAEDSVFVLRHTDAGFDRGIEPVSAASAPTASIAHFANVLTRNAPGEKFLMVFAVQSGTNYLDLADEEDVDRDWYTSFADGIATVRAWGGDIGVLMSTWTAAPAASGDGYRQNMYPLWTGKYAPDHATNPDATYVLGTDMGSGRNYDHLFWDLSGLDRPEAIFDPAVTKGYFFGPHRFEDHASEQLPLVDPAGNYTGVYTSNTADTQAISIPLVLGDTHRLGVITPGTGTVTVEVSGPGATTWTTAYTGPADQSGEWTGTSNAYNYRITTTNGGQYFIVSAGSLRDTKQDTRVSIRSFVDDAEVASIMLPKGPEILLYRNGTPSSDAANKTYNETGPYWQDWSHPSDYSDDGLPGRARHLAIAALYALGVGPAAAQRGDVPVFNRANWATDRTYVDLWYEDTTGATPTLSTTRLERGLPAIPATFAHRTEVAGLFIDGIPAERTAIVGGRVRVYPDPAATFADGTSIQYGLGGASGVVIFPEDEIDNIWMDLPIAVNGVAGVEGIALEPLPDPDDIADPNAPDVFAITGSSPWFQGSSTYGANAGLVTMTARVIFTADTTAEVLGQRAGRMSVQRLDASTIRYSVNDSTNTVVTSSNTAAASFGLDIMHTITLSVDLPNQVARIWVNGVLVVDDALIANAGDLDPGRQLTFLASGFTGEVEYLRGWSAYVSDGDVSGLGAPLVEAVPDGAGGFTLTGLMTM